MSPRILTLAEYRAKAEAAANRDYMSGSYRPRSPRPTLSELMGWPPMPDDDGRRA